MPTKTPSTRRLHLTRLEDRVTPANVNLAADGTLEITTGNEDQRLALEREGNDIVVRSLGVEVARFDLNLVSGYSISTGAGNDRIDISPQLTLPGSVNAGDGRNVVKGGAGLSNLTAGSGLNKFGAGPGPTSIVGGAGLNRMVGGADFTQFVAGPGADRIVNVKPEDGLIAGPDAQVTATPDPLSVLAALAQILSVQTETLTTDEVATLLDRASAATDSNDAIIVVVDRNGRILGVRVEDGVSPTITSDPALLTFAVDGAVSKARTGAFFASSNGPLTSRTIQNLSQSTITERQVNSNPNIPDPDSTMRGPGFVAAVGLGGHFPPGIANTPPVDLFGIEHTNRDGSVHPGPDGIRGTADDIVLDQRFNINPAFVPDGQELFPPDSYGVVSGLLPNAQNRGIATLPGGVPIVKNGQVVGGIGVFFPGETGFATEENNVQSSTFDPTKPDRTLEAEFKAFIAVGGSTMAGVPGNVPIGNAPALPPGFDLPSARIDLVGITLDAVGPGGIKGPENLVRYAQRFNVGIANGQNLAVGLDNGVPVQLKAGKPAPEGWLVTPHDGVGISAEEVSDIILRGINQAIQTRAAIREIGNTAKMVFAVSDREGNIVGLYRMPDATVFSIDVAVAKARNVNYYADPNLLQPEDQVPGSPPGTAFTNRTFRYLAQPRFPSGIDGKPPGPFSILQDGGVDPITGLNVGDPLPASAYQSVYGFDAFNPGTNFRDPTNIANQNGIVFFPGSAPLYRADGQLIGGFGVSGDGVDQDDVVTFAGTNNFGVPLSVLRADQVKVTGIRLPYQKFNRNPEGGIPG